MLPDRPDTVERQRDLGQNVQIYTINIIDFSLVYMRRFERDGFFSNNGYVFQNNGGFIK